MILQKQDLTIGDIDIIESNYIMGKLLPLIWTKLQKYLEENKQFLISDFYDKLEPEEIEIADELFLRDVTFLDRDEKEEEIKNCAIELEKMYIEYLLKRKSDDLKKAELEGDSGKVEQLNKELSDIVMQKSNLN